MCTAQKYPLLGSRTTAIEQTAVLTADEFITQNADLIGLYPGDLQARLTERLTTTPVLCEGVLDPLALLRVFVPAPPAYTPSHYGLLLRDDLIVGFVWIPVHHDIEQEFLFAYSGDAREITHRLLACDATALILATTMSEDVDRPGDRLNELGSVTDAMNLFDVDVRDWLLLCPGINYSLRHIEYVAASGGEDGCMDEATAVEFEGYGTTGPTLSASTFFAAY